MEKILMNRNQRNETFTKICVKSLLFTYTILLDFVINVKRITDGP